MSSNIVKASDTCSLCDNCVKKGVCRYTTDIATLMYKINRIPEESNSGDLLKISISCKEFYDGSIAINRG